MTGTDMGPGSEQTFCTLQRLPNDATVLVRKIESQLSAGSHHLVVYRSDEQQEQATPFSCSPFTELIQMRSVPLFISQINTEQLQLPAGVVYELAPHQMVRIEAHYINLTSATITPTASVKFNVVPDSPELQRADFMLIGTPDIRLPPNTPTTVGPYFVHSGIPAGAKIWAMTTHTHHWGTQFRVQKSTSRTDPGTSIYDYPDWSWDAPPVKSFDTPLTFAPGEGTRFTCEYLNRSSSQVNFGESALAEMCVMWLYYYPSAGYKLCLDTNQGGAGEICCPGNPYCSLVNGL
jgi:hypothetical protein